MTNSGANQKSGHDGGGRGSTEPSAPLTERAAIAAKAELRGERTGILGATGRMPPSPLTRARRVPERWSLLYVMECMEDAFRTLARLPMATRPRGYVNSMPLYPYDRGDLNSQLETYELERMAQLRNRVRIPPSPAEIARMEEALRWPAAFLSGAEFHHVARAVNLGSLWAAFETDVDAGLKRNQGYTACVQRTQAAGPANHHARTYPSPCPDPVRTKPSMAGADVEPNPAAAPRWAASERAGLIAAYRDGLGVAAVTMICGPAGFRIVPSALGDNAVLTAGETMQARWWCRRATDAQRVATAATARLRRRSLGGGDAASGVMALASDLVKSAARQCNVMLHSEQEISEEALDAAARNRRRDRAAAAKRRTEIRQQIISTIQDRCLGARRAHRAIYGMDEQISGESAPRTRRHAAPALRIISE